MRSLLNFLVSSILILCVSFAHADHSLKEFGKQISDSVITAKITAKFTKNRNLNPLKIYVSTLNGIVTLRGNVKDKQAFVEALQLVKVTKGVKAVDADDLEIKQVNTPLTDAYITAKVEAAVLRAKVFDDESIPLVGINASTTDGTVTLSGNVKSEKSIVAIIKRVTAVRGVKKIISKLEVNK